MKKKMQINRPANAEKPIKATRPAKAEKPIKPAERADAVCPYAKKCGGCDYQGMPYEKQLKEKQAYVQKQVGNFCKVLPILGMDEPYHYRNKVHPEISTVIINVNDKRTSMVLGDKESVIYGKGYIEDTLCGCTFRISPKSFYQVNPVQTELLYGKAIAYAALTGNETVVDAYCGTGTIGIIAAKSAKKVIGVELNRDAGCGKKCEV